MKMFQIWNINDGHSDQLSTIVTEQSGHRSLLLFEGRLKTPNAANNQRSLTGLFHRISSQTYPHLKWRWNPTISLAAWWCYAKIFGVHVWLRQQKWTRRSRPGEVIWNDATRKAALQDLIRPRRCRSLKTSGDAGIHGRNGSLSDGTCQRSCICSCAPIRK
jgi:hypothetical protein